MIRREPAWPLLAPARPGALQPFRAGLYGRRGERPPWTGRSTSRDNAVRRDAVRRDAVHARRASSWWRPTTADRARRPEGIPPRTRSTRPVGSSVHHRPQIVDDLVEQGHRLPDPLADIRCRDPAERAQQAQLHAEQALDRGVVHVPGGGGRPAGRRLVPVAHRRSPRRLTGSPSRPRPCSGMRRTPLVMGGLGPARSRRRTRSPVRSRRPARVSP